VYFAGLDTRHLCFTVSRTPQDSHVGWSLPSNRYECVRWQWSIQSPCQTRWDETKFTI